MRNKLIKFILSFTDYDRLKKENEKLKKDIYILIGSQGSIQCFEVISKWKLKAVMNRVMWFDVVKKEVFKNKRMEHF